MSISSRSAKRARSAKQARQQLFDEEATQRLFQAFAHCDVEAVEAIWFVDVDETSSNLKPNLNWQDSDGVRARLECS